jgi:hypothetical protein
VQEVNEIYTDTDGCLVTHILSALGSVPALPPPPPRAPRAPPARSASTTARASTSSSHMAYPLASESISQASIPMPPLWTSPTAQAKGQGSRSPSGSRGPSSSTHGDLKVGGLHVPQAYVPVSACACASCTHGATCWCHCSRCFRCLHANTPHAAHQTPKPNERQSMELPYTEFHR